MSELGRQIVPDGFQLCNDKKYIIEGEDFAFPFDKRNVVNNFFLILNERLFDLHRDIFF